MQLYLFKCKECGRVLSVEAQSREVALLQLAKMSVCPMGKHPVLLSMRESTEDFVPED